MQNRVPVAVGALGLVVGIVGAAVIATVAIAESTRPERTVPLVQDAGGPVSPDSIAEALATPCPTEDSDNCFWVATAQGNGLGRSFVAIEGHRFPLASMLAMADCDPGATCTWSDAARGVIITP